MYSAQPTGLKGERDFLDDNTKANYVESLVKEIAALSHGWDPTELLAAGDASELLPGAARPEDRYIRLLLPVLCMPPGSEVAIRAFREEGKFLLFTVSGISKLRVVPLRVATSKFPYPGCHLQISSAQLTGLEGEHDFLEDNMEANYVDLLAKEIAALLHGWDPTELLAAEDASELFPALAAMKIRAVGCLRTADRAEMGMAQHQVGAKGLHLPTSLEQLVEPSAAAKSSGASFAEANAPAGIKSRPAVQILGRLLLRTQYIVGSPPLELPEA